MKECSANKIIKISIIIVTYNAEKYLQTCLDSIRIQKFQNFEIIIIDGGSTDSTIKIIKNNEHFISFWKTEKDKGIYDAMNKAIGFCTGEWVYFLGSDDVLLSGFSEMAYKISNTDYIYYGECITDDPKIFLGGKYSKYRLAKINICHHAIFYPKRVFDIFRYETKYIVAADHVLNIKCWNNKIFKWQYFPISIAMYRLNGFSSNKKDYIFKKDRAKLVLKYLGLFTFMRFRLKQFKQRNNPKSPVN